MMFTTSAPYLRACLLAQPSVPDSLLTYSDAFSQDPLVFTVIWLPVLPTPMTSMSIWCAYLGRYYMSEFQI